MTHATSEITVLTLWLASLAAAATWSCGEEQAEQRPAAALTDEAEQYIDTQREEAADLASLPRQTRPEVFKRWESRLVEGLRERRDDAERGDLLDREVAQHIRAVISEELSGPLGPSTRAAIENSSPSPEDIELSVNALYPDDVKRSTVPPGLLEKLPRLPPGVRYRFVGRSLLLVAADGKLILDHMPDALPEVP